MAAAIALPRATTYSDIEAGLSKVRTLDGELERMMVRYYVPEG